MADALDSKSCVLTDVWVRLPPLVFQIRFDEFGFEAERKVADCVRRSNFLEKVLVCQPSINWFVEIELSKRIGQRVLFCSNARKSRVFVCWYGR